MRLRLGTRKSALALAQSTWVKVQIESLRSDVQVDLVKITTGGDKILDVPLAKVGGKGLFVKEIEDALLRHEVDLAVHSMKDVPVELPEGLEVAIFPRREDPRDALISRNGARRLAELPEGACVGTSSLRRVAQLRAQRPDLKIESLRGNLDTRLRKLDEGQFDAILLATAGLHRLGLADRITEILEPEVLLPAIGQGALGIEIRGDGAEIKRLLAPLHHEPTALCVRAERAFLTRLEGGCQVPIGALARLNDGHLSLEGLVAEETGTPMIRRKGIGRPEDAAEIGIRLAEEVLAAGGEEILRRFYDRG